MQKFDVVIVGAGAAGIGMAIELEKIFDLKYCVLEADRIGESFRRWPAQTRFISPSFHSNPFGMADLNAVDSISSPATFAGVEHPSGAEYADYLSYVVDAAQLPVITGCKVLDVTPDGGFYLNTERGEIYTQFLIWACGEYLFPDLSPFPGGGWCRHYAQIEDWTMLDDEDSYSQDQLFIGGYESGLDSAINLIKLGYHVRLLVKRRTWDLPDSHDPSVVLSPYTRQRLREVESDERLEIIFGANVTEVSHEPGQGYRVHAEDGRYWDVEQPPILGTGFQQGGGARQIKDLWSWGEDGNIVLGEMDESIHTPGLFLVGPQVRNDNGIYCFIYKFRQRFSGIASQIALRLQLQMEAPEGASDGTWGPFGNSECCGGCEC